MSDKHEITIKDESRQKLVDCGYASEDTVRMMNVYRLIIPEDIKFDPSRDKLNFRKSKLYCGVCLTKIKTKPGAFPEDTVTELDDFMLGFKGPLDAPSKHMAECQKCKSVVQFCGDQLEISAGTSYIITLQHITVPPSYLKTPFFEVPILWSREIKPVSSVE